MAQLFTVNVIGDEFWYWDPDGAGPIKPPFPDGVTPTGKRASFATHKGRTVISGAFSSPMVFDEDTNINTIGLLRPAAAPTLAASVSAGNVDGDGYGAYAYRYKIGDVVVAQSDLSPVSATITFANKMAEWSGLLPSPDEKATHIVGYRSMEGGLLREAFERGVGATGATDNRPELSLGNPPPIDSVTGEVAHRQGVPPWTLFNEVFANRAWYAGDPRHPYRVWFSEVDQMEAVGPTSYLDTRDGETVTGIRKHRDTLIVFCRRCCYIIRAYTRTDFTIFKLDPEVGCVSHQSVVNIENVLWWASEEGACAYDGGRPRYIMEDLRRFWMAEYEADPTPFLNSTATLDPKERIYKLLTPRQASTFDALTGAPDTPLAVYYCCDFSTGFDWYLDKRDRRDSAVGRMADGRVITGSSDGYIRLENVYTDPDDDADTYLKTLFIRTKHHIFDDPGGTKEDGKQLIRLWSYVTREGLVGDADEDVLWSLYVKGGDEDAWMGMRPTNVRVFFKDDVEKTLFGQQLSDALVTYDYAYTPSCVRVHPVAQKCTGRGFTFEYEAASPLDFRFIGLGGNYGPGKTNRAPISETVIDYGGLVSFWKLGEASGDRVDGIGPNDLVETNGVAQAAGKVGNAALFVAANSENLSITDGAQSGLNPGLSDLELSIWFYPIGTTGNAYYNVLSKGTGAGTLPDSEGYAIWLAGTAHVGNQIIRIEFGDGDSALTGFNFHTADKYVLNAWNHLYVYFDRDDVAHVYLNGVKQTAVGGTTDAMSQFSDTTGDCSPEAPFCIGARSRSSTPTAFDNFYDGRVDAVAIGVYPVTLTNIAARAAALYNDGHGLELGP